MCPCRPIRPQTGPEDYRRLRLPGFLDNRHMKVAAFNPQEIILVEAEPTLGP